MHQPNGKLSITTSDEETFEMFREMMRVDHKRLHSYGGQVIEGKADERFLKNWDERLG